MHWKPKAAVLLRRCGLHGHQRASARGSAAVGRSVPEAKAAGLTITPQDRRQKDGN